MKLALLSLLFVLASARNHHRRHRNFDEGGQMQMGGSVGNAGGWSDVTDQDSIDRWVGKSVIESNKMRNSNDYFKLRKVVEMTQQVVAGMNYHVKMVVGKTDCRTPYSSDEREDFDANSCEFLSDEEARWEMCEYRHFFQSWTNTEQITVNKCSPLASEDLAAIIAEDQ